MRRAHQRAVALFMEETAGFDVTPVQFAILHELLARPGEDQVTLASRVAFDAATSGSVIGRLEKRGWIRREPDTRDRRRKLLWITPDGEVAALQMRDAAQRVQERLVAPLSEQEREDLMALLARVVYNHQDPAGAVDVTGATGATGVTGVTGAAGAVDAASAMVTPTNA